MSYLITSKISSMISNPCNWFKTGGGFNDQVKFTYEGGKYLYHFDCSGGVKNEVRSGWTGNWMQVNVVFFADSEEHARDVFKRMLEFRMETASVYHAHKAGKKNPGEHDADFARLASETYRRCEEWLGKINEAVFTRAPTNQFYTVGWADNDTIL